LWSAVSDQLSAFGFSRSPLVLVARRPGGSRREQLLDSFDEVNVFHVRLDGASPGRGDNRPIVRVTVRHGVRGVCSEKSASRER